MFVSRKHPKFGRPLSTFPLCADEKSGNFGYKIGYCDGCSEPILIRSIDLQEVVDTFGISETAIKNKRSVSFRHRVIRLLGGTVLETV